MWYDFFGGRKAMFVILFLGLPEWFVLIWSYFIQDWAFAKFFTPLVLFGILAYLGINVTQKKLLNGANNGKKD